MLVISAYIELEMWLITLAFACSLFIFDLSYRGLSHTHGNELKDCLKRVPWEMIPFIISMFVIVLSLDKYGVTGRISELLECSYPEFSYGVSSFLTANMINNIPMSVLFCPIIGSASAAITQPAVYAAIVGSNLGALLTPVGALAAIMWSNILKKNDVPFKFTSYIKNGVIVSIPALFAALAVLSLGL
jgi:arsenical pump membrane protein